jgi:hypothetical protein
VKANGALAERALEPVLQGLERATEGDGRTAGLEALGAIVTANGGLAERAFDLVLQSLEQTTGYYERTAGLVALGAIVKANGALAERAFDLVLQSLERATVPYERAAGLWALRAIVTANGALAERVLETVLKGLERATEGDEREAGLEALGAIVQANAAVAERALKATLEELEREAQKPLYAQFTSQAFETTLTAIVQANPEATTRSLWPKLTAYGAGNDLRSAVRAALAAGFVKLAKRNDNPEAFLFDHLEGRQTLMPQDNPDMRDATTCADYRRVIERAIALYLNDETTSPEVAGRIRRRLEAMRDGETRLHLRVAAWDTLIAVWEIRNAREEEKARKS